MLFRRNFEYFFAVTLRISSDKPSTKQRSKYSHHFYSFMVLTWTVKIISRKNIFQFRWKLKWTCFRNFRITCLSFNSENIILKFWRIFWNLKNKVKKMAKRPKNCSPPWNLKNNQKIPHGLFSIFVIAEYFQDSIFTIFNFNSEPFTGYFFYPPWFPSIFIKVKW